MCATALRLSRFALSMLSSFVRPGPSNGAMRRSHTHVSQSGHIGNMCPQRSRALPKLFMQCIADFFCRIVLSDPIFPLTQVSGHPKKRLKCRNGLVYITTVPHFRARGRGLGVGCGGLHGSRQTLRVSNLSCRFLPYRAVNQAIEHSGLRIIFLGWVSPAAARWPLQCRPGPGHLCCDSSREGPGIPVDTHRLPMRRHLWALSVQSTGRWSPGPNRRMQPSRAQRCPLPCGGQRVQATVSHHSCGLCRGS